MNSNIHLKKNDLNEYFKAISHYLRVHSLSGFYNGRSMNILVFFVVLAEVQVTFLSVNKNLSRQGLSSPCRIRQRFAACCYLSQKYLAIRQRTCSKQRKKILVGG